MRKHNSDKGSRSRFGKILQRAISLCFGLPVAVIAGPEGEQVIAGDADVIRPDLVSTQIFQHSNNLLLDWNTFDIATDEIVIFHQPGSNSIAVNRVVGGTASEIYGQLQANGQVFLLNPQGVFFSPTAQLDVHGLVAAAGTMNTADFLSGKLTITTSGETVENQGTLVADNGGYILLAGSRVENHGRISTEQGSVGMASGGRITLNIAGDELIGFTVDEATVAAAAGIENTGDILNDGGFIALEAKVAHDLAGTAINQSGRLQARRISNEGGRIQLLAEGGDIDVSGEIDADGTNGEDGGNIHVHGDADVMVRDGANIHADGANGGMVRNIAERSLDIQQGSIVSAVSTGNGNGGFIEVSGYEDFTISGDVLIGDGGTFLLDPASVSIVAGSSVIGSDVGDQYIEGLLNGGTDVLIVASNDITVYEGIGSTGTGNLHLAIGTVTPLSCPNDPACSGAPVLTLLADGTIDILTGALIKIGGDLRITAQDGLIRVQENLISTAGDIILDAGVYTDGPQNDGVINTGSAAQTAITLSAGGNITINAGDAVSLGTLLSTGTGNITITADGGTRANSGNVNIASTLTDAVDTDGNVSITAMGGTDSGYITTTGGINAAGITLLANSDPNGGVSSVIQINGDLVAAANGVNVEAKHNAFNFGAGDGGYITVTGNITSGGTVLLKAMSNAERGGVINAGNITSTGTTSIQNKNSDFNAIVPTMTIGDINANLISINLQGNNFVTGAMNASSYVSVLNSGGSITVNGDVSSSTSYVAIQSGSLARPAGTSLIINGNVSGPNGVSLKSGNTSIDGTSLTLNGSATSSNGNVWVEANGRDLGGIVNVSGTLTGENVTVKAIGRTTTGGPAGVITIADATATVGSVLIDARGMESPSGLGTGGDGGNITAGTLTAATGITVDSLARGTSGGNIAIDALSITGTGDMVITAISEGSGSNIDIYSAINNAGGKVELDADARNGNGADITVADTFGNALGVTAATDILMHATSTGTGGNITTDALTASGGQVRIGDGLRRVSGNITTAGINAQTNVAIMSNGDISTNSITATTGLVALDTSTSGNGIGNISTGGITAASSVALSAIGGVGAGNISVSGTVSGTTVSATALGETTGAGSSGSISMIDITASGGGVTLGATGNGAGNVNNTGGDGGNISAGTINANGTINITATGNGTTGGNIAVDALSISGTGDMTLTAIAEGSGANIDVFNAINNTGGSVQFDADARGGNGADIIIADSFGNAVGVSAANDILINASTTGIGGNLVADSLTATGGQVRIGSATRRVSGDVATADINAQTHVDIFSAGDILTDSIMATTGNATLDILATATNVGDISINGSITAAGSLAITTNTGLAAGNVVVSGNLSGTDVNITTSSTSDSSGFAGSINVGDITASTGAITIDALALQGASGGGAGMLLGTLTAATGITVDAESRGVAGGNITTDGVVITGTGDIALTASADGGGGNVKVFSAINNTGGGVTLDADARGGNGGQVLVWDGISTAYSVSAATNINIGATTTGTIGGDVLVDSLAAGSGQVRIGSSTRRVSGDVNTGAISAQTNVDIHGAGDISTAAIVATTGGVTLDTSTTATGLGDISTGSITAANAIALSAIGGIGAGNVNIGGTVSGTAVTVTAQGETTSSGTSGSITMADITTTSGDVALGATGVGAGNVNGTGGDGGNIAVGTINSSGNITVTAIGNGTTGGNIDSTGGMTSGNGAYTVSLNATAADTGANVTLDDGLGNRQDITSGGGINIHATAGISGGDVTAGNITGLTFAGSMVIGGPSGVTGSIDVGNLTMGSNQIILRSSDGSITTGDINASDSLTIQTTTSSDNLGNISVGDIAANSTVSIQSAGGANGGNITAGTIGNATNNVSISTNAGDGGGNIRLTGTLTAAQNASLSATGTGTGGSILIEDTGGNAMDVTAGNGIVIFASNDVTAGNLTASGALARVGSSTSRIGGDVNLGNVSGQTNVDVYGAGDITTGSLTATTGNVTIDTVTSTAGLGNISTATLNATGTVTLSAAGGTGAGNIAVSGAINGGNISATALGETTSSGTSGSITLTDITANSGGITLTATGTGAGNINGTGGDGGNITVGTLTASGAINVAASGSGTTGGNIAIDALSISGTGAMMLTAIAEGSGANIDVFSAINNTSGSVQLDADARGGNGANITVSDGMGTLYGVTAGTDVLIDATATGTGGGVLVDSLTATGGKVRIGSTTRRVSSNLDLSSIAAQTTVDIFSSGNISVDGITATTAGITLDTSSATAGVGNISAGTLSAAGNIVLSAVGGTGAGNIAVTGPLNAGGLNATAIAETTGSGPSGSITLADVTTTSGAIKLNATGTGAGNVNGTGGDGGNITVGIVSATGDIDFRATSSGTTGGNIASGALASSAGDVIIRATGTDAGGNVNVTGNVSGGAVFIDTQGGSGINGESGSVTVTGNLTATAQTVSILADANGGGSFDGANITVGNIDAVDSTGIAGTSFVSRFRSNSNRSGSNITMGLFDGDMLSLDANSTDGGALSVGDVLANTGFYASSAAGGLTTGNVLVTGGEMNIDVADDATFGTVEFTVFDDSTPWYIISRDGSVAMQALTVHADAGLSEPSAVEVHAAGGISIGGDVLVDDFLVLEAGDDISLAANLTAGGILARSNGAISIIGATDIGDVQYADTTPVFDADLNTHLADNGLSTVSGTAAASFIANSVDFGGTLTYAGDYLYLAADSLSLTSASLADPDAVVQIATFTPGTIISLENVADTTAGLNLAWTGMLGNFSGGTIVLGRSSDTSDMQIGSNGTIDIGTTNFMALTSGTVDSTSQLVSTGVVAAPLGTVPVVEEPFLPPQSEEIEPVAEVTEDVADEQATDENEEEEEGLADADGDTDNSDESSLAISSSTAETLQCE